MLLAAVIAALPLRVGSARRQAAMACFAPALRRGAVLVRMESLDPLVPMPNHKRQREQREKQR